MNKNNGLIILGFGGHARSVADVALSAGYNSLLFIDENARDGETFLGFTVQREFYGEMPEGWSCMPAIGDNSGRQKQVEYIASGGWPLATVVSNNATIGAGAEISPGCFIAHHAHVGPMANIGIGCIINTGAVVEHESKIENFVHISVNSTISGRSVIGGYSFIGAGATVIDGINICNNVTVGAGSVVIKHIKHPGVYVGSPAYPVQKK
jgi:UDP-N-acetylbacillosamine N-acetyltransferase